MFGTGRQSIPTMTGTDGESSKETLEHIISTLTDKIARHDDTISRIDSVVDTIQKQSDKYSLKLEVPSFSGDNVLIWIFQMERLFAFHQTPADQRLNIAPFYMTGVALNWYHLVHRTFQLSTWEAFIKSLESRFLNTETTHLNDIITQTSTVSAYIVEFEALATHTSTPGLANLLDSFISGLRDDIKQELLKLKPSTLLEAMCMAKLVEAGKLQSSPITPSFSKNDSVSATEEPQGTSNGAQPQISLHSPEGTVVPVQRTINDDDDGDDDVFTSLVDGGSTHKFMPISLFTDTGLLVSGNGAALDSAGCFFEEGCRRSKSNDFISQLPDEVLVMILSLLSIKESAITSILSTRWRLLWRDLIQLNFDGYQTFDNQVNMNSEVDKYINQVNSVIQSYNHPIIEGFRIRYCLNNQHKFFIDEWLQFAVNKKVEFLELDLSHRYHFLGDGAYDFPLRLFERNLLRSNYTVVELVSLKKLILKDVKVSEAIFQELLSNAPSLETLSIRDPQYLSHIHVGGRALKLKHFEILTVALRFSVKSIYLSDFDLESFTYVGEELVLSFFHLPKLKKVDLGEVRWWRRDDVFNILSSCASSLQSLSIEVHSDERYLNPNQFYELPNVKQLRMMFRGNKHDCLLDLAYMVNAFPNMESFKLEIDWTSAVVRRKARDETYPHEHLKFVEIVGYKGRKCDFELAAYIIDIADALKKIVIRISRDYMKDEAARSSAKRLELILPQGVELVIL